MGTGESISKAKTQANDMTESIVELVNNFAEQAKTNTKKQNKKNLSDLMNMKK